MTISQGASVMRRRISRIKSAQQAANKEQAEAGQKAAVGLTSGPSRSRNAPSPVMPRLPIGRRSRKLVSGWKIRKTQNGRQLYNTARHHVYVLAPKGTKRMKSRRYWEAHLRVTRPQMLPIARKHIVQALKGN